MQGGLRSKCKAAGSMKAGVYEHERQTLIVGEYFNSGDGKECMCLCMRV